ncbi:MAG: ABC transporter ATP-binding protein/permease [bacterium]|nr:ABC transporter ATP-binding protein/permease [bacterium]
MKLGFVDDSNFSWRDMIKAIFYLLENKKKEYLLYTGILVSILFYDLVPVLIVGKIVDFFTNYNPGDSLNTFYFLVIILAVGNSVVALIRLSSKKALSNIQSQVTYSTKVKGFERLLDFSIKWHDSENTGNKVQKIENGISALKDTQQQLSNGIFPQGTAIIGVLIAFIFMNPSLFVYCLLYAGVFILIQASFYKRSLDLNYTYNSMVEKASGTYYEGLSNILTLKTLGVKNDFKTNIMSKEELSRDFSIKMTQLGNNKWKLFQILNGIVLGGVVFLTGQGFIKGAISLGSIFIIFNYFQKLSHGLGESTGIVEKLIRAKVSMSRMMPIFWEEESIKQGTKEFPEQWDKIFVNNASFSYWKKESEEGNSKENDRGLSEVTLTIAKNEKIGVVGQSGSGKSTLAKLLVGLYHFESGEYKIGDKNFYDVKHDQITNEMVLVLQDSEMFNLSLKENITLMRIFDAKLWENAVQISQLKELIERLPEGAETLIGEKGYRLSGGERQRIGIARAIYKDPQILVLDEATSSLDSKTESLIQEAFEEKLNKKTIISIAHRVSTLKNVDKIIVFDEGKVVEEGTYRELSENKSSKFFDICQYQKKTATTDI